jgi:capsule polysaccharide export protein KpsE/RkpR
MKEVKAGVAELKTEMKGVKADVTELKTHMTEVKSDVTELKADVSVLKDQMKTNTMKIQSFHVSLENQVQKAIRIIAENHLELSRKFDKAIKNQQIYENLEVRMDAAESKIDWLYVEVQGT